METEPGCLSVREDNSSAPFRSSPRLRLTANSALTAPSSEGHVSSSSGLLFPLQQEPPVRHSNNREAERSGVCRHADTNTAVAFSPLPGGSAAAAAAAAEAEG